MTNTTLLNATRTYCSKCGHICINAREIKNRECGACAARSLSPLTIRGGYLTSLSDAAWNRAHNTTSASYIRSQGGE